MSFWIWVVNSAIGLACVIWGARHHRPAVTYCAYGYLAGSSLYYALLGMPSP